MKSISIGFKPSKTFIAVSLATSAIFANNALGASCDNINTYPNFPQVDWQGNPSHASGGDLMQHEGNAYKAKWYTSSIPGSDNTWQFEHSCGNVTDPTDPTDPTIPTEPSDPKLGILCKDYTLWSQGDVAKAGDVFVNDEYIAYAAKWETSSRPGSDDTWVWEVNCDGTAQGTAPLLSLPNASDPVNLEMPGWPSDFVVASPSSAAPAQTTASVINSADLTDITKLTNDFVALIQLAAQAGTSSVILQSNVLDNITQDKGVSLGAISVKQALTDALATTNTSSINVADIEALSDDAAGWAQAQNLIMSSLAPNATFGWSLSIGTFAYDTHSGKRSVWDAASKATADLLDTLSLYKGTTKADFIAFTKSSSSASLTNDQWHNALEYVKQVTDFVQAPALLSSVPTAQATTYFMGNTLGESNIRKAAHSNIFAILFDTDSTDLTDKIARYQNSPVPLYYIGTPANVTSLTSIASLNNDLTNAETVMDSEVFLYETPNSTWVPSTIYKWADFLTGLNSMHNVGVAGEKFWLIDETKDDATNALYAKVAIAAFLSQSMQETIRFDACDENNWSEVKYGAAVDYPMTASCGQLGQKYADYGTHPVTGNDHPYSCPRDDKMEQTATTHAKWYGAPAPIFVAPDAVLEEQGLLVNGKVGRWTNAGHCNTVPTAIDTSKQVYEREECKQYVGQKAGSFIWDGSDQSVQGCGWWGRGVIQTTGRQNFGTLNHFVGRSHVDPDTIGTTVDGVTVAAAPDSPLYADLDLCSNPGLVCSSEEHKEIKWIAGLFFWVNSVQAYNNEGGPYADWNYYTELKKYVDGGLQGTAFVDAVSGIVNRGCPDDHCPVSGEVHAIEERRANFKLVLQKLGLNPL
ncbi:MULTISPECIES: cellulose-binding domain-containing protein [unclassified Pseudoalteromonas]|uniref:cellulose-binding domain-containing protein n=1 Tax=unclassified Pseudoalteromonas TaxID=194690 RepID=UPI000C06EDE5|nr:MULTISPECIES: cellulose-binding domain-containing protein [unclassified Pseudoalteromonas]MDP2634905.1 cellulose-binding domain-containing protein [Pseudoalteromonas sp. 1_MG-2023]PHN89147.1 chitodextrinase [Pseudoalteromonas sp. 3D05]